MAGDFRDDLFYRLNVVPIELPPLRERRHDIPALLQHFLDKFNGKLDRQVREVAPEAVSVLSRYGWPGNIRELENLMERVILLLESDVIEVEDLPAQVRDAPLVSSGELPELPRTEEGESLKEVVRVHTEELERELIVRALDETGWNVTHTAQRLGISRKGLQLKMKEYGLRKATASKAGE